MACQDHFSFEPLSLLSAKHVAKFCFVIGKHYLWLFYFYCWPKSCGEFVDLSDASCLNISQSKQTIYIEVLMYKTALYTLVNGVITHHKPQTSKMWYFSAVLTLRQCHGKLGVSCRHSHLFLFVKRTAVVCIAWLSVCLYLCLQLNTGWCLSYVHFIWVTMNHQLVMPLAWHLLLLLEGITIRINFFWARLSSLNASKCVLYLKVIYVKKLKV